MKIVLSSVLLLSSIAIVLDPVRNGEAVTIDEIKLESGAPFWFELEDYDKEGDELTLTILFLKKSDGTFQERPIDIMILRASLIRGTPDLETLSQYSMYYFEDVNRSIRDQIYENTEGGKMSILFLNEYKDSDKLEEPGNTTVKIRVDYTIKNAPDEGGSSFGTIIIVLLVIIAIIGLIILGFYLVKRKIKDRTSFYNTNQSGYYVFRDIDDSVYYFTPQQYAKMYSSNSLVTYEYLGQASKKGGPILNPSAQMAQAQPVQTQPISPVPMEAQPMEVLQYEGEPDNVPDAAGQVQGMYQDPAYEEMDGSGDIGQMEGHGDTEMAQDPAIVADQDLTQTPLSEQVPAENSVPVEDVPQPTGQTEEDMVRSQEQAPIDPSDADVKADP